MKKNIHMDVLATPYMHFLILGDQYIAFSNIARLAPRTEGGYMLHLREIDEDGQTRVIGLTHHQGKCLATILGHYVIAIIHAPS